jgi:dipeptidyl aminopeptidase/acylaminoacyl peptidase
VLAGDVYELTPVSDPRIGPDGRVAFVVTTIDREQNEYLPSIWLHEGGTNRRLTDPAKKSSSPRWSPDGSKLAFVSNRDTDKMQLYVMPMAGGEPNRLTSLETDIEEFSWSADGTQIAFATREQDPAYEEQDEKKREPRRITRLFYKLDNEGWIVDRPRHLWTVSVDGSDSPASLTKGEFQDSSPVWSPDGTRIAFAALRTDDWDVEPAQDIYVVDQEGGEPTRLTSSEGTCEYPAWSPDGTRVAFTYTPGIYDIPRHGQIATVDVASGTMKILTASLDRNCAIFPPIREVAWDGDHIYFCTEDHGNTHLYRVRDDGSGEPELVVGGDLSVTGFDARDGREVHTSTTATTLPELFEGDNKLTGFGDEFNESKEIVAPERFTATSADGHEVEAWIMKPPDLEPGARYPVLLNIHGGPFTQYGNRFFDEFQIYARLLRLLRRRRARDPRPDRRRAGMGNR